MITLLVQATEKAKKFADETAKNAQHFAKTAQKEVTETLKKLPETDFSKTGENLLKTFKSFSFATPGEIKKLEARIARLEARLDDALSPITIDDGEEEEAVEAKTAASAKKEEEKPEKVLKTGTAGTKKTRKKPSSRENLLN